MAARLVEIHQMVAPGPLTAERAAALVEAFARLAAFGDLAKLELHGRPADGGLRLSDRAAWAAAIEEHWQGLRRLVCYDYGQDPGARLEIDLRSNLVTAEVAAGGAQAAGAARGLAETLGLTPVAEDLFRYRRTAVTYQAAGWDVARFAGALETTVRNVTGGAEPALRDAYYTYELKQEKNVERLRGFFTLEEMVASLRGFAETDSKAASLRDIEFSFEGPAEVGDDGPHGRALGIYVRVSPAPVQVTFLSSLRPEELDKVTAPIRIAVELGGKPVAARVTGHAASGAEVKTADRFWVKYLAVPVLAALATTLVSTTVLQAVFTDRELEFTAPVEKGGEYTMSRPGPLELQWYERTTDALWRRRDFDVPARVEVVRDGQVVERAEGRSKATVTLAPGTYTIVVRAEREIDPIRLIVKVTDPQAAR